ncbi:S8 family serine peptidase [bacterium]|nr:S8 family serine peptidase [bacterium]
MQISVRVGTLLLALALVSCAGQSYTLDSTGNAGVTSISASLETAVDAESNGTWREWLTNPGTPGVDYDPTRIAVFYNADAEIPAQFAALKPPAGQQAADQPNAVLRENSRFEQLTDYLAAYYGLTIRQQLYWGEANFACFGLGAETNAAALLAELNSAYPGLIERAYFDRLAQPAWTPSDPDYSDTNSYGGVLWGIKIINCAGAWDYTRGSSDVVVAVVDSGVRVTHEDLAANVLSPDELAGQIPAGYTLDIVNGDNTVEDISEHGTMCAGAVAADDNGLRIVGVAPDCRVLPIKINNDGTFPWTDGYAGITLAHLMGAEVISCSWGHTGNYDNQELQIINQVTDGGSLVIGAAGNDNVTTAHYPSDFAPVVCVGASDPWDAKCDFSNYGSAVDIAAPGQWMKRCRATSDSAYSDDGGGTSYACPVVAGAAALLFSLAPALTPAEVKAYLETTGDAVSGFAEGVRRLNVGAAVEELNRVHISIDYAPTRLLQSGIITLTPQVTGEADRVECYLDGDLVGQKTAAPWDFAIDTSGIDYGLAEIAFWAYQGTDSTQATLELLVDNSTGQYPVVESFDDIVPDFIPLDIKHYDPAVLAAIHTYGIMGNYWTPSDLANDGPGTWHHSQDAPYHGANEMFCGLASNDTYGNWEMDALVSRRIDLREVEHPTLVFYHHYNIQAGNRRYDRGLVFVTTDYGATYTRATTHEGDQALFSGYVADYTKVEIDLSAFAGQQVHLVYSFESGKANAGQEDGQPAGWWVDDISVAADYQEHPPALGPVSVAPYSLYGQIVAGTQIAANVLSSDNVAVVRFVLDCAPLGTIELYDAEIEVDSVPFNTVLTVPGDVPNQLANLQVLYYNDLGEAGQPRNIPVYIFNQLGDTNADGNVDAADLDGYPAQIGLSSADAGYIPFYDSDLDGVVTESDAGAVGYHFSPTAE